MSGSEKELWNLVDRAQKMFLMAIPDNEMVSSGENHPIKAWMADATAALAKMQVDGAAQETSTRSAEEYT